MARHCSRTGCTENATVTLTFQYASSLVWLDQLSGSREPHAYDLCVVHGTRLKVPHGWSVIKQELDGVSQGPSDDDLMAIADAVREVASKEIDPITPTAATSAQQQIGRRGHLRAVPS